MSVESKFENKYKNYKEEFTELLDEVVDGSLPVLPEMRAELDEVYAQAAKADEYKAKAKAFDALYAEFYSDDISLMKADFDEALEYERGEIS